MLKVRGLTKNYHDRGKKSFCALKDVSFDVKKGEIICVVGPSGSGKTTLLKCLAGLDNDYSGRIRIRNKGISSYLKKNRIALVSQKYSNFAWLTVHENVATGFYGSDKPKAEISDFTDRLLKRVGLFRARDSYPSQLSGGMQQRVAIARAIAQQADIIVLDEPFGALDVQTRSQMQEFLAKLWEEERRTMILVTHDIDEAIYLANRIFVLGTNPGAIKEVIEVDIGRPRKPEIRFQEDFVRLKKFISYIIRSESIKASLEEGIMTDEDVFKVGLIIWPGNTPFYYAKDSGLFALQDLNVEQINFDDNAKKIKLWKEGKLDAINVTLDTAVGLHSQFPGLRIVGVLNRSLGGDALIAQKKIKAVSELKGKAIGVEKDSPGRFLLLYALNKAGLSSKDVKIRDMKCGEIGAAIIAGKVDAGILWEPWLTKVQELSDVTILKTTKDYPVLYDVLVVHEKVFGEKRQELEKIAKVWKDSVRDLDQQREEVINAASSHIGISDRELAGFLEKVEFFGTTPKGMPALTEDIEKVLFKEGVIEKRCSQKNLFDLL